MPLKLFHSSLLIIAVSLLWYTDAQSSNSNADDSFCQRVNQSIQEANAFLQDKATLKAIDAINKGYLGPDVCQSEELTKVISTITDQAQKAKNSDAMLRLAYFCEMTKTFSYRSEEYLTSAANLGSVEAMYALGIAYTNGYFGLYWRNQRDTSKAAFWWGKAASVGDPNAKTYLADLYDDGDGVLQDYTKARHLRQQAASKGQGDAMFALGDMYLNGRGVAKNFVLAYMWINLSAQKEVSYLGWQNDVTIRERNKAAAGLSPSSLLKAQEMSRICLESNYKKCGA